MEISNISDLIDYININGSVSREDISPLIEIKALHDSITRISKEHPSTAEGCLPLPEFIEYMLPKYKEHL